MRFRDQKTGASKPDLRRRVANNICDGFTLIELLVATAIIAILIALLLPAIQKAREEYAANMAAENLQALLQSSNLYLKTMGSYPSDLGDLADFCAANPGSCSLDPELFTGRVGGYTFDFNADGDVDADSDVDGADFLLLAEPEVPGITGSVTLTIDRNGVITSTPTPGADAARQQAFDDILAAGAQTAVELLALDPNATSEVREYVGTTTVNAGTLATALDTLDADNDGMVSINEINAFLTSDPAGPFSVPLNRFLDALYRELKLDGLSGDDLVAIRVDTGNINDQSAELLFSYEVLADLTIMFAEITDGSSNTILAKLEAAEAAEASGNLKGKSKALKQYRNLVKAERGKSLTRAEANILITISNTL